MLVSLLLFLKSTVFLPVVLRCFFIFTDAVQLISGRGLIFCARGSSRVLAPSHSLRFRRLCSYNKSGSVGTRGVATTAGGLNVSLVLYVLVCCYHTGES